MVNRLKPARVVFWIVMQVVVSRPGPALATRPLYFASVDGRFWQAVEQVVDDLTVDQVKAISEGADVVTSVLKSNGAKFLPPTKIVG
jgi:hypothetical protein